MAAREESAVGDLSESPPTTVPDDTADTAEAAVEVAMQAAAELPPVEAPETPAAQVEAKQVCIVVAALTTRLQDRLPTKA